MGLKTAVILSGQARSFSRCFANLKWQVFDRLESPHFFVSVADDADAESVEILRAHYPVSIERVAQPVLSEPPFSACQHAPYAITPTKTPGVGPLQGIMRQLWHNSRAWKFAAEKGAVACDLVVRCRMDLHFHRFVPPVAAFLREDHVANSAWAVYWGGFGGINDRFSVLGIDAAKAYFETFDNLPAMLAAGIPFHPETLVGAALERAGCTINRTLLAEFAFCRKPDAQHADYWFEHMQVLPGELAEWTAHLSKQ